MENNQNQQQDLRIVQIIDANLDRAREGLRVLEEWARYGLGRVDIVKKLKDFRQILGVHHLDIYKNARNYTKDKCNGLEHPEQFKRVYTENIISSNASRIQEALRVLEEFSRNNNYELSKTASMIRYEIYNLEIELLNAKCNQNSNKILLENNLYSITNEKPDLIEDIENLLIGGVKIIQHRFKDPNDSNNLENAKIIRKLCKSKGAIFIVNDRVDIAIACDADGVHLGQNDLDIVSARKILGFSKIIGISANNGQDIKNAIEQGSDYLGIGPVFKSNTKTTKKPLGIEKVKKLTKDIKIPWFAIGGIKNENIPILKSNGIKKVAIVSEIMNDENPKNKAMIILKTLSDEN
tara:strand:- start:2057 stop:3109 length:1053 start_codon:yes stop_codon:yes gene_type:complete